MANVCVLERDQRANRSIGVQAVDVERDGLSDVAPGSVTHESTTVHVPV